MAIKIEGKITGYEVVSKDEAKPAESNVVHMHEQLERPDILLGSTYKIKTPLTEHALYVTINDMVLNQAPRTRSAGRSRSSSTRRAWTISSGWWP